jgi:hypothetical protein
VRKPLSYYVTISTIVIVSTVVAYINSYYWGPGWGYRSVPVSLFKALSLPTAIFVVWAVLHVRNREH